MFASVTYWSGVRIRGSGRWPAIERWVDAFEAMPSYLATKSDYYTHVMDIPPQYGPGYAISSPERARMAAVIDGSYGGWKLPLAPFNVRFTNLLFIYFPVSIVEFALIVFEYISLIFTIFSYVYL